PDGRYLGPSRLPQPVAVGDAFTAVDAGRAQPVAPGGGANRAPGWRRPSSAAVGQAGSQLAGPPPSGTVQWYSPGAAGFAGGVAVVGGAFGSVGAGGAAGAVGADGAVGVAGGVGSFGSAPVLPTVGRQVAGPPP